MYIIARNILRFIVVVVFQVLVMDNVMLNGYMDRSLIRLCPWTYH